MLELLSPAGSPEAVKAAVQNGADAIYMGLGGFNARRSAANFTAEEFNEAVRYCHVRGAKVYVTLNTLVTDREMSEAAEFIKVADHGGADGLIVQDLGLAALARQVAPQLPLHGSTQMSVHNLDGVRFAQSLGLSRVILARELNIKELAYICASSPIEIEVFVHGALCMSYSGQCYMSAVIGRRSGNRGACAQPCRLPYGFGSKEEAYPLSLKDNCLLDYLRQLEQIGVKCVKIEGRAKRPEYVAVATRIYKQAIESGRPPGPEERRALEIAFSRQGFTDGYLRGKLGPEMFGVREEAPEEGVRQLFAKVRNEYENKELQRVGVRYFAIIREGEPSMFAAQDEEGNICKTEGPEPQVALHRPLSLETLNQQLGKSGGTPYYFDGAKAIIGEGLSLSAAAINAARRELLSMLTIERSRIRPRERGRYYSPIRLVNSRKAPEMTVSVQSVGQITPGLLDLSPKVLYLPLFEAVSSPEAVAAILSRDGITPAVIVPRIVFDSELAGLKRSLDTAHKLGIRQALVGNAGLIEPVRSRGFEIRGDFGLNIFNSSALEQVRRAGLLSAALSFELNLGQIRDISKPIDTELIAYGRLPLMISENCVIKNKNGQCSCGGSFAITDRKGMHFPIARDNGSCRSVVLNSQKLYIADKYDQYSRLGLWAIRLMFTTENPSEIVSVIGHYVKKSKFEPTGYTRGLYFRGVE